MFGVKKCGLEAFSKVSSLFLIAGEIWQDRAQGAGELGPLGKHICVNVIFTM